MVARALPLASTRHRLLTFRVTINLDAPPVGAAHTTSLSVYEVTRAIFMTLDAHVESFVVLALDAKRRVRGFKVVSTGTQSSSLVHPREVFLAALALGACGIVLAHNHPSGDPTPSPEDEHLTQRLAKAGEIMGINVLDHLVLGDGAYVSFSDRGWITLP